MDKKNKHGEPTELLPIDDPRLVAWTKIVRILEEAGLPKNAKFRRIRIPKK